MLNNGKYEIDPIDIKLSNEQQIQSLIHYSTCFPLTIVNTLSFKFNSVLFDTEYRHLLINLINTTYIRTFLIAIYNLQMLPKESLLALKNSKIINLFVAIDA